jgi:hypothetical protein
MNTTHLYIGDELVDLKPDQVIALTVKSIEIGVLQSRYVSYTNTLFALKTENNNTLLGYSNTENSTSIIPYRLNSGKVVQNGIETIPSAAVIVKSSNEKGYALNVYDSLFDYFALIKGLDVTDVQPFANSAWDAAAIDSARTNTSGIVTVVLNWGKSGAIYQVNYFLPCFYYKSLVTSVLQFTGLTLSGDILTDARFTDLVIPYWGTNFAYPNDPYGQNNAKVEGNTVGNSDLVPTIFDFTFSLTSYGGLLLDFDNDSYNFRRGTQVPMVIDFSTYSSQDINNTIFNANVYVNGVLETTIDVNLGTPPSIFLDAGDVVTFTLEVDYSVIPILEITFNTVIDRASVSWNLALSSSKLSCDDLIKDFFTRFALIPKISGGTLYLKSIEEIITDRANAIDWSGKIVDTNKQAISFDLSYAQNNYFEYKTPSSLNEPILGRGIIEVDNTTSNVNQTIYSSFFENCLTDDDNTGAYKVARIEVYDTTSTGIAPVAESPGIKLLTLKSRTTEGAITFNAISRTDYKLGYFVDSQQTKDTGFQYFIDQFYTSLQSSLQRNKVLTKYFNLTEMDIAAYDPHKIIYDGEGYYLINKISNFVPGKITSVELFKIW